MTDYSKPGEALRCCIQNPPETCVGCTYNTDVGCNVARMMSDAADAIEALQAEVGKANKSADAYRAMYFTKRGDITIEKVRELDEIDYHFHLALIRLMYKRIEKLESELEKKRTADCWGCKCEKMEAHE